MSEDQPANPSEAPTETGFDPRKAIAELVGAEPTEKARRLTFYDQCSAFYALYNGARPKVVAAAFGVTKTTVSLIGGCLTTDPRPYRVELVQEYITEPADYTDARGRQRQRHTRVPTGRMVEKRIRDDMNQGRNPNRIQRYGRVAEEFHRLGEGAFAEKYYTNEVHTRLMRVKYDIDGEAARRGRKGADPKADSHAGPYTNAAGEACAIVWLSHDDEEPIPGWFVQGPHMTFGRPTDDGERRPFQTSRQAWDWSHPK
jgi:hypothetical protein